MFEKASQTKITTNSYFSGPGITTVTFSRPSLIFVEGWAWDLNTTPLSDAYIYGYIDGGVCGQDRMAASTGTNSFASLSCTQYHGPGTHSINVSGFGIQTWKVTVLEL